MQKQKIIDCKNVTIILMNLRSKKFQKQPLPDQFDDLLTYLAEKIRFNFDKQSLIYARDHTQKLLNQLDRKIKECDNIYD